jgi:hypothetical protein
MKKKLFPVTLLVLVSVGLPGCPVYDDDTVGCYDDYDCSVGYYCDYPSGACLRYSSGSSSNCSKPSDCAANETCSKARICAEGDCHFASVGCVSGFECSSDSGRWECVREGSSSAGGEANGGASSSGGEPASNGGEPSNGGAPAAGAAGN